MRLCTLLLGLSLSLLLVRPVHADDAPAGDITDTPLEDLLNPEIGIASVKPISRSETPSVVTTITRDDIIASGARDLLEVLLWTPGFGFGVDVYGVVGAGFRGLWGHEGKILLLIDDIEMNEVLFATTQFGNHYPVAEIEKIEIIRGPGSVIYGGAAELAVISVTTRSGKAHDGYAVRGQYGQLPHALGRADLTVHVGHVFTPGVDVSVNATIGRGNRSDLVYRDFFGNTYNNWQQSNLDPLHLSLGASYAGARVRVLFDNYHVVSGDNTGIIAKAYKDFRTFAVLADYVWHVLPNLSITPRLVYRRTAPWDNRDVSSPDYLDKTGERSTVGVRLLYDITHDLNLLAGAEGFLDRGYFNQPGIPGDEFYNNQRNIAFADGAVFAQLTYSHPIANLTAGARYEYHSAAHSSLVPRVGLTHDFGTAYVKGLYSNAFRAPSIEDINAQLAPVRPEQTRVFEIEAGWRVTNTMLLSLNLFNVVVEKPLIYTVLDSGQDGYINRSQTGSNGAELEYRWRYDAGDVIANYSYYNAAGLNKADIYAVPGQWPSTLALANHKITAQARHTFVEHLTVSPTAVIMSPRWGYLTGDGRGNGLLGATPWTFLLNVYVAYEHVFVEGLSAGLGLFNVFAQPFAFLQPYNAQHAPLPGLEREVIARLSYTGDW